MNRQILTAALALVLSLSTTRVELHAQASAPEKLLASDSILYLNFDGIGPHRKAWNQTITGELLRNEFGALVEVIKGAILEALGPKTLSERLLSGARPDELLTLQKSVKQLPKLLEYFDKHGVVLGVEVHKAVALPRFQVTLVFPEGGRDESRAAILGGVRLIGLLSKSKVKETKVDGRTTLSFPVEDSVTLHCWQESNHVVMTIGTEKPDHTLDLVRGKRKSLDESPLWRNLKNFKEYETYAGGFVDIQKLLTLIGKELPIATAVTKSLGLDGLEHVSFHLGVEGKYQRSTFLAGISKRRGLLRMVETNSTVAWKDMPPLPPDAAVAIMSQFNWATGYEGLTEAITDVAQIFGQGDTARQALKRLDQTLGFDVKGDLLGALDSKFVVYSSPSEGPLALGTTLAIRVKNRQKLQASLDRLGKTLSGALGADIELGRKPYEQGALYMLQANVRGNPFQPAIWINDDWAVFGLFPQSVQGFVARLKGGHRSWKIPANAKDVYAKALSTANGRRIAGVTISDPRPTTRQLLSIAPVATRLIGSFTGANGIDISVIPNSQMVTDKLVPNVTIVTDDGKTLRYDSHASLPMPLHMGGLELYIFTGVFGIVPIQAQAF